MRIPFIIALLLSISGCSLTSHSSNGILNSLRNRGAVPLSTQNPYIAGNLLLSSEMARSPELTGFIKNRGAPRAIEVVKEFASPTLIRLYYTETQEYYVAEESGDTWLITGPEKVPPAGMKLLLSIIELTKNEPLLKMPPSSPSGMSVSQSNSTLQQQAATEWLPRSLEQTPEVPPSNQDIVIPNITGTQEDPLIPVILKLKDTVGETAEISPKGDLVHYVTYSGESLTMISRWYTLDARNVGRIARINNITNPGKLEIGDTIIIPGYLVKNKARLTEATLRTLHAELAK